MVTELQSDDQTDPTSEAAQANSPGASWQFSLRAMFIAVTVLIVFLAWFVSGPERQRRTIQSIRAKGGEVYFEEQRDVNWFVSWLPSAYYLRVKLVGFRDRPMDLATLELLLSLDPFDELIFWNSATDDDGLVRIGRLVHLKRLWLTARTVTDAGLAHLSDLQELRSLYVGDRPMTDAALAQLAKLSGLQELDFYPAHITDAGMAYLGQLTKLRNLNLYDSPITDTGLAHLANLTDIEELKIDSEKVTDQGLVHLVRCQKLKRLEMRFRGTRAGFINLGQLKGLEQFAMWVSTDEDLAQLTGLTNLKRLSLASDGITDAGLGSIRSMTSLQHLTIHRASVTDLSAFREMKSLKSLSVDSCAISDQGVSQLHELKSLESLSISGSKITDVGRDHLKKLTWLKRLNIRE